MNMFTPQGKGGVSHGDEALINEKWLAVPFTDLR
jgi:hypothetical protein